MKKLIVILGFVLSILFLVLALKDTNFAHIKHAFSNARYWTIVPMALSLAGFYWLKAIRWSVLLSPSKEISPGSLVPAMMGGAAGNNLMPAHLGEVVRVFVAGKALNIPKSTVLATLVVERLFDIIIVLVLFSIGLMAGDYSQKFYIGALFLLCVALVVTALSAVLIGYTDNFISFIDKRFTFVSAEVRGKVSHQIENLGNGLVALRKSNLYFEVITNTVLQWVLMACCIYFSLFAFDISVSPTVALVVLGLLVVGLSLPTSPGFFGTIEYCFVLALGAVGVDASAALSAAVFYHLPNWICVTLIGLVCLRKHQVSLRDSRLATVDGS